MTQIASRSAGRVARNVSVAAVALGYWMSAGVPALSPSRTARLPIGDNLADDPGLYVIVPALMPLVGDPHLVVWLLALVAFTATLVLLMPRGPLVVIAFVLFARPAIAEGAAYWVPAWAMWTGLFASPAGSGIVALLSAPFRSVAGPPLVAWSWRSPSIGAVVLGAYLVLSALLTSHLFWHTAYIGLGWYRNDYGITYVDESGIAAAARIDPAAEYATPAYEAVLRGEVIRIATSDPGFVGMTLGAKLVEAITHAAPWVLLLPLAIWRRPALAVPVGLSLVPVLMAVPIAAYETGWLAAVAAAPLVAFSGRHDHRRVLRAEVIPAPVVEREHEPGGVVIRPRSVERG